jgi:hypothetical protein
VHRARPRVGQVDMHLVTMRMGGPIQIVSSPGGVFLDIAVERSCGPVPS